MYVHICKFCNLILSFEKHGQIGGHVRNCKENPNREKGFENLVKKSKESRAKIFEHNRVEYFKQPSKCLLCSNILNFKKRKGKYCNSSCSAKANNYKKTGQKRIFSEEGKQNIRNAAKKKKGVTFIQRYGVLKAKEISDKISKTLSGRDRNLKYIFICPVCKVLKEYDYKQKNRKYCSGTCRNFINNQIIRGTRSKAEKYLEEQLVLNFPNLEIIFNSRKILNRKELDVYIPFFKLGIEWNGIWHYMDPRTKEYRNNSLKRDNEKIIECKEKGIELIVIKDLTSHKKFIEAETIKIIEEIKCRLA